MLPDLPSTRGAVHGFLREFLKRQTFARTGVWQQVRRHVALYECCSFEQHRFDGSVDDQDLAPIGGTIRLELGELQTKGFAAVLEAYDKAAIELAHNMSRHNFARMDQIFKEAGQSYNAGGRPLTPDLFLEFLEKMEMDFDSDGKPCFPSLVVPPNLAETVRNWDITNDQQRRFEQIIDQQRLTWRDRESDRRLVD